MLELKTRSGRRASQHPGELLPFISLLKDRGVRSYLEIGARHGDTFFEVMMALPRGSRGVAVDLGGGAWGTPKSVDSLKAACSDLQRRGYRISMVLGDSTSPEIIRMVGMGVYYDAILIDGDHRYDGVKADWLHYGHLSRIVAFHDIAGEGQTTKDEAALPVEVPQLWRELKEEHPHREFIAPDSTMGIGVIIE